MFVVGLVLIAATLFFGAEVKGARRWIVIARRRHPALGVREAGLRRPGRLAVRRDRRASRTCRATLLALGSCSCVVALLVLQPDFGQTMLIALVWGALFFMAGMRWSGSSASAAPAVGGIVAAYSIVPHVRGAHRALPRPGLRRHLPGRHRAANPSSRGGWFGRGPGEGTVKRILPDATPTSSSRSRPRSSASCSASCCSRCSPSSCCAALLHALRERGPVHAASPSPASSMLFGMQSAINMAVNLHLMPAKGMTLPFISYGGSSMISLAFGMGMLLALTRDAGRARADSACEPGRASPPSRRARPDAASSARSVSCSRPAAPAGTCSRPRRWPTRCSARGVAVASRDRRPRRRAIAGDFPAERGASSIPSATTVAAAIRSALARDRVDARLRRCCKALRAARAGSGRPRSSASAAIRPCRRCSRRRCAASRPSSTSRTP